MKNTEADAKAKYNDSADYSAEEISVSLFDNVGGYSAELLTIKRELLLPLVAQKDVLDLGCGNGRHLADLASQLRNGLGLDFSVRFIKFATETFRGQRELRFAVSDARALPIADRSIDCCYSFATMYYIDDMQPVYRELSSVIARGGHVVLELGNSRSLSTLVSREYDQFPRHSVRTIGEHVSGLRRNGFRIVGWRSFQILPMWGDKPDWLQILRRPAVEKFMMRRIKGRMIDEWISSLPGVRHFAFRHLVVAQKT